MPYRHFPALLIALVLLCGLLASARAWAHEAGDSQRLAVTTYPELAAAVRQRLAGKAAPTPALITLARQLTSGRADARARALALSDWVRIQVRNVDAGLRLDGAAPHMAADVLARREGTGEEIVLLLQALLTANGIDNTAALVDRGRSYLLPETPTPEAFDHMLVWLPGLDLYLDPATASIAAGYLPPALLGKPVLLLAGARFAMTPLAQPQSVRTVATIDIRRDGSSSVTLDRRYAGALAEPARRAAGQPARLAPADGDEFRLTRSGVHQRFASLSGAGGLPTTHPELSMVADAMAGMPWESPHRDVACPAVDTEDETRYRLPKKTRIVALPQPVSVTQGGVFYRAAYERQGNAVVVKRRLTFRNGRPTCTPAEVRALQPALARIAQDLRSRIRIAGP